MVDFAARRVTSIRWDFNTKRPFAAEFGILATDRLRYLVAAPLKDSPDPEDFLLEGHRAGESTESRFGRRGHAHWLWIENPDRVVSELAVWVPAGLAAPQRDRVLALRRLTAPDFGQRGYVPGTLGIGGVGSAAEVLGDVGGGCKSTVWRSAVPYLMTRHTKRSRTWEDVVRQDIQSYLNHYHGRGAVHLVDLRFGSPDHPYRTTRWDPRDEPAKALWIDRLEVDVPLTGPVCLGRHSHFGFGRFVPLPEQVEP